MPPGSESIEDQLHADFVSILVVVDHAPRGYAGETYPCRRGGVSILVVVDHAPREGGRWKRRKEARSVSILVVVDHAPREGAAPHPPGTQAGPEFQSLL